MKEDFYDVDWNKMNVSRPNHPNTNKEIMKPDSFSKMIEIAEMFSTNIPFLRVDFYEVNGHLYFGEFTFYPASGMERFSPHKYDEIFGSWLTL